MADLVTIEQLAKINADARRFPNTQRQIRYWITSNRCEFRSQCTRKIGRRVLIDMSAFEKWTEEAGKQG